MKYYIRDTRNCVGNCVVFWRHNGAGYTTKLDDAWIVGEDWKPWRDTDVKIPVNLIEIIKKYTVDAQDLNRQITEVVTNEDV